LDILEILHYQTSKGCIPFQEWLREFKSSHVMASILTRIDRLALGNYGDCKPVGAGVFELRLHFGAGYRIYFGQAKQTLVILLMGGDKQTQDRDILKAKEYWKDYLRRKA